MEQRIERALLDMIKDLKKGAFTEAELHLRLVFFQALAKLTENLLEKVEEGVRR